jgi:hypothetical protein
VKVLAVYLLRCAAWGRRNPDGVQDNDFPSLTGGRPSAALSLNDALSKKTGWICEMFGTDNEGRPYLLELMQRSNADLKRPAEPVILCLDRMALPPQSIEVAVGDRELLKDAAAIDRLADEIEQPLKPTDRVVVRLEGTLRDWAPEKRRRFDEVLKQLGFENYTLERVEEGSINLTLKLPPEEAEQLFWAVHSGELDELGVLGIEYVRPPEGDPVVRAARAGPGIERWQGRRGRGPDTRC